MIIPKTTTANALKIRPLILISLVNYSRKIGLISYNLEIINNILNILPVEVKNLS
jgi:hypothetical protein